MKYFVDMGYKVAPFKIGPDFIDPGHHQKVCNKPSINLDSWMLSKDYNKKRFLKRSAWADLAIVEGVMGLFDGYSGISEAGSTAQMAKILNLPVILIVDAKSMARSVAAIVQGFENFDKDLKIAGIIFNRVGSPNHYEYLKEAVINTCKSKPLGYILRNEIIHLPDRHLGLVTAEENSLSKDGLVELVSMIDKNTSLKDFVRDLPLINSQKFSVSLEVLKKKEESLKLTIAVARDKAFSFYYKDNIDILIRNGAEIIEFSPLKDTQLPDNIHGLYLGGGYPELFANQLSQNVSLLTQIKTASCQYLPIYAECGGFMYLCSKMTDTNRKNQYPMAGCFPFSIEMNTKFRSLGYREITLRDNTLLGKKGDILRGHEFHYSSIIRDSFYKSFSKDDMMNVYKVTKRDGKKIDLSGFYTKNTLGSYLHLHFGSMPGCGKNFITNCINYKNNL